MAGRKDPAPLDRAVWHPWLRIQRLIRVILETRWGRRRVAHCEGRASNALKERSRLERAGWFKLDVAKARLGV